jgi:hypothetical protein
MTSMQLSRRSGEANALRDQQGHIRSRENGEATGNATWLTGCLSTKRHMAKVLLARTGTHADLFEL